MTVGAQGFKFVLSTVAAIVLARLLTPDDYGLIGMVAILVNFVGMFQYLGLSTATVKWAELNHQQVSTLFWINMALERGDHADHYGAAVRCSPGSTTSRD